MISSPQFPKKPRRPAGLPEAAKIAAPPGILSKQKFSGIRWQEQASTAEKRKRRIQLGLFSIHNGRDEFGSNLSRGIKVPGVGVEPTRPVKDRGF
jgi:hypothetical protein